MYTGVTFSGIVHQSGGCGLELLGALDLLQSRGVPVRCIVPTGDSVAFGDRATYLKSRGVDVVEYFPGVYSGSKVVVSFGEKWTFDYIRDHSDCPRWLVWSGCMSWATDQEIEAHSKGWVDEFFFQSKNMAKKIIAEIEISTNKEVYYRDSYAPFLNQDSDYAQYNRHINKENGVFRVCKAVRDDALKWHPDHWKMCAAITTPVNKTLKFKIAGWGDNARKKIGNPCDPNTVWSNRFNLFIHGHLVSPVEMAKFYGGSHVLLHYYPFVETFGFATVQSMIARCVPIGAPEGGFLDLIRHGQTGFLARSPEEAAYYASKIAFEDSTRTRMSEAAAKWVAEEGPGNPDKCWPWWEELLKKCEISF